MLSSMIFGLSYSWSMTDLVNKEYEYFV